MKFLLSSFFILLIFTGCQNNNVQAPLKAYHDFNNFDYSKKSIEFYEKEFETISSINNPKILKEYYKFYDKNSSYFVNGKQKAYKLLNKYLEIKDEKTSTSINNIKETKKLAKQNNIQALRELVEYYKIKNPKESLKYLKKLVELKDIKSMKDYASASIYINRPILVQNIDEAIKTYEELAELGELSSIMRLGNIYEYGYHKSVIEKDLDKSLEYYEQAANLGYSPALKKLLKIYSCEKCKGDRFDSKKAKEIKEKLAKTNINQIKQKINKPKLISKIKKKPKQKEDELDKTLNFASITKNKGKKETLRLTCYDMKIAQANITKECKKSLEKIVKEDKITSVSIIPVLDTKDQEYLSTGNTELLYSGLSYQRAEKIVWYLRSILKDDSVINTTTYFAKSKKSNRGVVVKVFK